MGKGTEKLVVLNIGGKKFTTSLSTIKNAPKDSLFAEKLDTLSSSSNEIFIDRDGTNFRYILNYLRDGDIAIGSAAELYEQLQIEAQYYHLPTLVQLLAEKFELYHHVEGGVDERPEGTPNRHSLDKPTFNSNTNHTNHTHTNHTPKYHNSNINVLDNDIAVFEDVWEGTQQHTQHTHTQHTQNTQHRHTIQQAHVRTRIRHATNTCKLRCSKTKETKQFSWDEVKKHCSETDCWIVVKGVVFDVTDFLPKHPAGAKAILKWAGTDCTYHYDFHSGNAHTIWKSYKIGKLEGYRDESCVVM